MRAHNYCQEAGGAFTRCRPYRNNDQAWIEQKYRAVVRRMVGYRRLEGVGAAAALARLYASVRLFVNFFQPSFKLADKQRDGARIKKRYHQPATPYQRLLADPRTPEEDAMHATLDPVRLLREIRVAQQRILEIADKPIDGDSAADSTFLEQFLVGLRRVWRDGEARPTARAKAKTPRLRRRPDPFATVSAELRAWFKAEPAQTERELFERLQAQYPGTYPDGQLRTCQRRFKGLAPGNGAQAPLDLEVRPITTACPNRVPARAAPYVFV